MKQRTGGTEARGDGAYQAAIAALLLALLLFGGHAAAVEPDVEVANIGLEDAEVTVEPIEPLAAAELAELVGPIALYPDDLLSIVLAASTYPLQIVQASRFLQQRERDADLQPDADWDNSVVALLNYPEALALLNDDLDWTWKLGQAVLVQQEEVLAAVGDFRQRARVAGNLESDERQVVEVVDDGAIEIKPADPEVIYVPYYEPSRVTVYHDYPVYHYYPRPYPVYYYPYPAGYRFSAGYFWGVTSAFSIGWSSHRLHMHHHSFYGHPYYGRTYYDDYYYRRPHLSLTYNYYRTYDRHRYSTRRHHAGNYWRPRTHHYGSSPRHAYRLGSRSADRDHHTERRHDRERDKRHDADGHRRRGDRSRDAAPQDRPRREVARGSASHGTKSGIHYRERKQRRKEQSPRRGSKLPTHPRDTRAVAVSRTQSISRLNGLRATTQGNRPEVTRAVRQRDRAQAPTRARAPRQATSGVQRPVTKQARSAPARVRSGVPNRALAAQQARAMQHAKGYVSRSAAPKARAPRPRPAAKVQGSGQRGARIGQSSANRSGKRMGFARN